MLLIPEFKKRSLKGSIELPFSKSYSHRFLMMQALAGNQLPLGPVSDSNDTSVLQRALQQRQGVVNFEDAGTPLRFYLAYAALKGLPVTITAGEGLKGRPIKPVIHALEALGAVFEFMQLPGSLPLKIIKGVNLSLNKASIDTDISSQFLSALLLMAPAFDNGLKIESKGNRVAGPYIDMTLDAMQMAGITTEIINNVYDVAKGEYKSKEKLMVPRDWSAAAFAYALAAAADEADVFLPGLSLQSVQGDKAVAAIFNQLGIATEVLSGGIRLKSGLPVVKTLQCDFIDTPDLFPAVAAACVCKGIDAVFTGVRNLVYKESNRILAMQYNLEQAGATITATDNNVLELKCNTSTGTMNFKSFEDHRIIMACSIFAFRNNITFDEGSHVRKSFPGYWNTLHQLGLIKE